MHLRWAGMLVVLIVVPLITHSLELLVHWLRGTAHLGLSILISATFTAISTAFNLFAMREDLLIVGEGQKSLGEDMKAMPRLIGAFLLAAALLPVRLAKALGQQGEPSTEPLPGSAEPGFEPLQETGGIG